MQSLERGLAVIRALSGPQPRTLSQVAQSTGFTRATARRFLLTLQTLGYVRGDDGRFSLTPQVLELGHAYLSSLTLPEVAGPHLAHLVEQVHESSSVSVLEGDQIVYVARVPARRIMNVAISVGTRFPAYATSMGRVLLAGLPAEALDRLLQSVSFTHLTPSTITSSEQLRAELDRVRADGFALVDQELERGLRSLAVPIRGSGGEVVAAVNVSVPASALTPEEIRERLLAPLQQASAAISSDLALAS